MCIRVSRSHYSITLLFTDTDISKYDGYCCVKGNGSGLNIFMSSCAIIVANSGLNELIDHENEWYSLMWTPLTKFLLIDVFISKLFYGFDSNRLGGLTIIISVCVCVIMSCL